MTPDQVIAAFASQHGRIPGRLELQALMPGLSDGKAKHAVRDYARAHPELQRAQGGARKGSRMLRPTEQAPTPTITPQTEWRETGDAATIECRESQTIRTLEELLKVAQVDELLWSVATHQVSKWDSIVKVSKDENAVVQMFRVHATLKRRSEVADLRRMVEGALATLRDHAPIYAPLLRPPVTGDHLLLLNPSDAHAGKLSSEDETGVSYTLSTALQIIRDSILTLTAEAVGHGLGQIVLVLGNDLMNMNDTKGQTYAGTQVDNSDRFWKTFDAVFELMLWTVEWLTQHAPVHVVGMPGNHGLTAELHLVKRLEAAFHRNSEVTFDASPRARKYYRRGKVLLGFAHGNEEPHAALPQIMADERRQDWAETTCREWITGHLHRKGERNFQPLIETGGVLIRTFPALCKHDAWADRRGYLGQAAGQAIVYSRSGLKAQYHHVPAIEAESA